MGACASVGKPGYGIVRTLLTRLSRFGGTNVHSVAFRLKDAAAFFEHRNDRFQVPRHNTCHRKGTPGRGRHRKISCRCNAVRDHAVFAAGEAFDALNRDRAFARTADAAHRRSSENRPGPRFPAHAPHC